MTAGIGTSTEASQCVFSDWVWSSAAASVNSLLLFRAKGCRAACCRRGARGLFVKREGFFIHSHLVELAMHDCNE